MSLGWLSCTWVGHFAGLGEFLAWAEPLVGVLEPVERRWRGYDQVLSGEHSVMVGLRQRSRQVWEIHFEVPATKLESLEPSSAWAIYEKAVLYAQNITRIDVTLDDWDKRMSPWDLELLSSGADDPYTLNKSHMVTRAEQSDFRRSKGPKGGDSWYLGSAKGETRLRVYDKARESEGEVDAIRWELQLRGDTAKSALTRLVVNAKMHGEDIEQVMGQWAASEIVRFVDFRDRSQDSNITRCDRLPWFSALVGAAEKARPVIVVPPLIAEDMHRYAKKALPSLLATLYDTAPKVTGQSPEQFIRDMLKQGRERRSARHKAALRGVGVTA